MGNLQLIVGLGNPGEEYDATRHNVGAWWIDIFSKKNQLTLKNNRKLQAKITQFYIDNIKCYYIIPTTYMNNSGLAVKLVAEYYQIKPQNILIIHDELDLPVGTGRYKQNGGHGGHNGLRDIITQLGGNNFYRLRIGIGHPGNKDLVTNYVLNCPSKLEKQNILNFIDQSFNCLPDIIHCNSETVMRTLHSL